MARRAGRTPPSGRELTVARRAARSESEARCPDLVGARTSRACGDGEEHRDARVRRTADWARAAVEPERRGVPRSAGRGETGCARRRRGRSGMRAHASVHARARALQSKRPQGPTPRSSCSAGKPERRNGRPAPRAHPTSIVGVALAWQGGSSVGNAPRLRSQIPLGLIRYGHREVLPGQVSQREATAKSEGKPGRFQSWTVPGAAYVRTSVSRAGWTTAYVATTPVDGKVSLFALHPQHLALICQNRENRPEPGCAAWPLETTTPPSRASLTRHAVGLASLRPTRQAGPHNSERLRLRARPAWASAWCSWAFECCVGRGQRIRDQGTKTYTNQATTLSVACNRPSPPSANSSGVGRHVALTAGGRPPLSSARRYAPDSCAPRRLPTVENLASPRETRGHGRGSPLRETHLIY